MSCLFMCAALSSALASTPVSSPAAAAPSDTVVLLHGLGRTRLSLLPLARALEREGFHVINLSYPWHSRPLEEIARDWLPAKIAEIPVSSRLHLVTHSMGGILVRLWLAQNPPPPHLARVVMLGPPNHGSPLVDRLGHHRTFQWLLGSNGPRLGTTSPLVAALPAWPAHLAELGVLAGDRPLLPFLDRVLPPPHDGKVTVASTHLDGEHAHRTLPFSHTALPLRRAAHAHVVTFLRSGGFPSLDPP